MQYVNYKSFEIALGAPVTKEFCIQYKTHYLGFSSHRWYQNTARELILKPGQGTQLQTPNYIYLMKISQETNHPNMRLSTFTIVMLGVIRSKTNPNIDLTVSSAYYVGRPTTTESEKSILKAQKINMRKFKLRDFVAHVPTSFDNKPGFTLLEIVGYDEKRKKYICLCYDLYEFSPYCIFLCKEEDLETLKRDLSLLRT